MPTSELLKQLYSQGTSSPDFLRILYALIKSDEREPYLVSLKGDDLTQLVDFLDDALCCIPTIDDVFRQCLRKLRAICGAHATLPSSHIITGDLTRTGESAIAYGGFADVWEGEHGEKKVCIKVLRVSKQDTAGLKKSFFKEAVVWKRLRHSNIVPFLGVTTEPLQFVSEWMPNGTLTYYVNQNHGANRIALLLDVAEGLNFLHASHTIHGDLKGPNILINGNGHACLADFGLASVAHGNHSIASHAHGYTARWTAPEILRGGQKITREADAFSFGMVVLETFTGKHPLSELTPPSVMLKFMEGERPVHPPGTEEIGFVAPVWNMTVDCWRHNPAYRPTMAAVVEFLRECYSLYTVDPSLSSLSPWTPTGNTVDTSIYAAISPAPTDCSTSPIRSTGTSQNSGHSPTPTQEQNNSQTFNILYHRASRDSRTSLEDSLSDESRGYFIGDHPSIERVTSRPRKPVRSGTFESFSGSEHKSGQISPKRNKRRAEKQPENTSKSSWGGIVGALKFIAAIKRSSVRNQGAR